MDRSLPRSAWLQKYLWDFSLRTRSNTDYPDGMVLSRDTSQMQLRAMAAKVMVSLLGHKTIRPSRASLRPVRTCLILS